MWKACATFALTRDLVVFFLFSPLTLKQKEPPPNAQCAQGGGLFIICNQDANFCISPAEVVIVSTQIDLLRKKCESDKIDANSAHVQIADAGKSKFPKDTWFSLSIERMFLEDVDLLENDIKNLQ
jgi:hypothetical protein